VRDKRAGFQRDRKVELRGAGAVRRDLDRAAQRGCGTIITVVAAAQRVLAADQAGGFQRLKFIKGRRVRIKQVGDRERQSAGGGVPLQAGDIKVEGLGLFKEKAIGRGGRQDAGRIQQAVEPDRDGVGCVSGK